jgi:PAS domain-containing protein
LSQKLKHGKGDGFVDLCLSQQKELRVHINMFGADAKAILAAVSSSQAIIEFTLDGKILTANENFCRALGYQLSEIQGRHHSMFC